MVVVDVVWKNRKCFDTEIYDDTCLRETVSFDLATISLALATVLSTS